MIREQVSAQKLRSKRNYFIRLLHTSAKMSVSRRWQFHVDHLDSDFLAEICCRRIKFLL